MTGVDLHPQPHYPHEFVQASYLDYPLDGYDLVHISPPCQRWTRQLRCRPGHAQSFPDHITPMRPRLEAAGVPFVIENVVGAPLIRPFRLCGWTFGREVYRHRMFESNVPINAPNHLTHVTPASKAGHWRPGTFISISGHCSPMWLARQVMEIDWMNRGELAEAIPPYFTEFIGLSIRAHLATSVA